MPSYATVHPPFLGLERQFSSSFPRGRVNLGRTSL